MIFESAPLCHNNHNSHNIDHNYPWSEDRAGTGQFSNTEVIILDKIFGHCLVIRKRYSFYDNSIPNEGCWPKKDRPRNIKY